MTPVMKIIEGYMQLETMQVLEGDALVFYGRSNHVHRDGKVDYGTWEATGSITNYRQAMMQPKKGFLRRLLSA